MPRMARPVFAGAPHQVIQRGNRREDVFFSDADRITYLAWLEQYGNEHEVDVLAYCLMTNHVHIIAVPDREDGLERLLRPVHTRYVQHVNRTYGWKGHVWQGRFFSSALDDAFLWATICYVDRNPVRVRLVHRAEDFLGKGGVHLSGEFP